MKEGISSFDIAVVTVELDQTISGFQIDNIYQINPKTLLLKLRGQEGSSSHLLIEAGKRIHNTSYVFEKPAKPPYFCMALRKYLRDGWIEKIQQYDFERIVEIKIKNRNNEYSLIIELFDEGNIILVGQENKILHALTYRKMKDRDITRNEVFAYPPLRGEDPRKLQREEFLKIKSLGHLSIVKALTRLLSIGGFYAEEVLLRAGIEKNTPCSSLTDESLDLIFDSLQQLTHEISQERNPLIFIDDAGNYVDAAPISLKKYSDLKHVTYQTFNEALDEYYAKASVSEKVSEAKKSIEEDLMKLERILRDQERKLQDLKEQIEVYSKIADTIYRHLTELQLLTQRIMEEKRSGRSWTEITEALEKEREESRVPAIYFQSLKPESLSLQVSIEGQTFNLNLKQTVQKEAAEYYMKAKKAKMKIERLEKAMKETQVEIEKVKHKIIEKAEEISEPRLKIEKKEWYEKFRWFRSSEDFLVIGGKDASTNEVIIKKYMEPQDIVFHADIPGAPFVLIKTQGRKPSEQTIKEAAQFAASYSRAWKEGFRAIDTYWVYPEQVSKHPPSGQYLPKGSFMIYGTKNYVKDALLEVAIGIKKEKERLKLVGGPPEAIAKQTDLYVKIVPGKETSSKLAKHIKSRLSSMVSSDERKEVLNMPIEEIQKFIPSGLGAMG